MVHFLTSHFLYSFSIRLLGGLHATKSYCSSREEKYTVSTICARQFSTYKSNFSLVLVRGLTGRSKIEKWFLLFRIMDTVKATSLFHGGERLHFDASSIRAGVS